MAISHYPTRSPMRVAPRRTQRNDYQITTQYTVTTLYKLSVHKLCGILLSCGRELRVEVIVEVSPIMQHHHALVNTITTLATLNHHINGIGDTHRVKEYARR